MVKVNSKVIHHLPVLIIFFLIGFFIFIAINQLGSAPLENWDEAFYGEAAKQILIRHDFIVMHWNGNIFLEKPPLQIWLEALGGFLFGLSEFTIRLPSAISGILIVSFVTIFSYRRFGFIPSLFAFTSIAFNNVFVWRSRSGNLDTLSALFFVEIFWLIQSKLRYKYQLLGVSFGLLYLTKLGLVLFPLLIFILYELIFENENIFKNLKNYSLMVCFALVIPGIWLYLGDKEIGNIFIQNYTHNLSQGITDNSGVKAFSANYFVYAYYSLQRRFTYFLIPGLLFLVVTIRKRFSFLLLLFSSALFIELSFLSRHNNWYLVPLMPFWSLSIAYAVWVILKYLPLKKVTSLLLILFCLYVGQKTYRENIIPIINSQTSATEAQTASVLKQLTAPDSTIVRLDHFYPTTIFYSDRIIKLSLGMSRKQLIDLINTSDSIWVAGAKIDTDTLTGEAEIKKKFTKYPISNGEEIAKFY